MVEEGLSKEGVVLNDEICAWDRIFIFLVIGSLVSVFLFLGGGGVRRGGITFPTKTKKIGIGTVVGIKFAVISCIDSSFYDRALRWG